MTVKGLAGTENITLVHCSFTNAYLIEGDHGVMAVDPGPSGFSDRILQALSDMGHQPQDISLILLTHAHYDHYGSAATLQLRTGATVAAHVADAPFFERGGIGVLPPHAQRLVKLAGPVPERIFAAPPVMVDRPLEDGDRLGEWQVLHTPGHTPGTISLYSPMRKVLITGGWACRLPSPVKWFVNVDRRQLPLSLQRLAKLDFQTLLCSHMWPRHFPRCARRLRAVAG
jgi:hydroxyacylglutathione hydrolase